MNNIEVTEISGLKQAKMLTHLDVRGMKGIKALDLTSQPYFEELKAIDSGVASVSFAKGAPVNRLELPATMKVVTLEQLPYLTGDNLIFDDITGITTFNIKSCVNLSNDFTWIKNWFDNKTTDNNKCSLVMDNVDWQGVNADDLIGITTLGNLSLKGKVVLTDISLEQLNNLMEVFGESAFDKDSDFYITAPDAVFLLGRTEILEGETEQFRPISFGGEILKAEYSIYSGSSSYVSIDKDTGLLSTTEGMGTQQLKIRAYLLLDTGGVAKIIDVAVKARVYPTYSQVSIQGSEYMNSDKEIYTIKYSVDTITGDMVATWSLTGMDGYVEIESTTDNSCTLKLVKRTTVVKGILKCVLTKRYNSASVTTITKNVYIVDDTIAETDPGVCVALYNAGLCASKDFITKDEAKWITSEQLQPGTSSSTSIFKGKNIKSFNGFKWFTGVTELRPYLFYDCEYMTSIELPDSITEIQDYCFYSCNLLESIKLPGKLKLIGKQSFRDCVKIKSLTLPDGIEQIGDSAFYSMSALEYINLPSSVKSLEPSVFYGCSKLKSEIVIPPEITVLPNNLFSGCKSLTSIILHDKIIEFRDSVFSQCESLVTIDIPESVVNCGSSTFNGCKSLITIWMPDPSKSRYTKLPSYHFNACISLKEITILEGYTRLSEGCIDNCTGLETLKIPKSIVTIDGGLARGCGKVNFIVDDENTKFKSSEGVLFSKDLKELYSYGKSELQPNYNIPEGVTRLREGAFALKPGLKSVVMPDTVTICDSEIFQSSKDITYIKLSENITEITTYMLQGLDSLESITLPDKITNIGYASLSYNGKLTSVKFPKGLITIESQAFNNCTSLASIELYENVKIIEDKAFYNCRNLNKIVCHGILAPSGPTSVFGEKSSNYTGYDTKSQGNKLIVPNDSVGYNKGMWADPLCVSYKCGFTLKEFYTPQECTDLSIVADDVAGNFTKTQIKFTAVTNGVNNLTGELITGKIITGTVDSDEFPQNTSSTDSVEREVTFTYLGVTANTTLTQGVWMDSVYSLDLNDGEWELSQSIPNPDTALYDGVYQSVKSREYLTLCDTLQIRVFGYTNFKFYIRSEGSYQDYIMVSQLDTLIDEKTLYNDTTKVKAHTRNTHSSGTELSNYNLVEFTDIDGGEHTITIIYSKIQRDSSSNKSDVDRGYVLIPKNQE